MFYFRDLSVSFSSRNTIYLMKKKNTIIRPLEYYFRCFHFSPDFLSNIFIQNGSQFVLTVQFFFLVQNQAFDEFRW